VDLKVKLVTGRPPKTCLPTLAILLVTRPAIPVRCLVELAMANLPQEPVPGLFPETPVQHLAMANLLQQHPVENLAQQHLAPVTASHQQGFLALRPALLGKRSVQATGHLRVELVSLVLVQFRVVKEFPAVRAFRAVRAFPAAKESPVVLAFPVAKEPPARAAVDSSQRLHPLGLRNIRRSTWSWD
jgi:hypothetical protein